MDCIAGGRVGGRRRVDRRIRRIDSRDDLAGHIGRSESRTSVGCWILAELIQRWSGEEGAQRLSGEDRGLSGKQSRSHHLWALGGKRVRACNSIQHVTRGDRGERKTTLHHALTFHPFVGAK